MLRRHANRVSFGSKKIWAQLTNSRDQLSHQIGFPCWCWCQFHFFPPPCQPPCLPPCRPPCPTTCQPILFLLLATMSAIMPATMSISMLAAISATLSTTARSSRRFVRSQRCLQNGNPKVSRTYGPIYGLTGEGARDTCVSKKNNTFVNYIYATYA